MNGRGAELSLFFLGLRHVKTTKRRKRKHFLVLKERFNNFVAVSYVIFSAQQFVVALILEWLVVRHHDGRLTEVRLQETNLVVFIKVHQKQQFSAA